MEGGSATHKSRRAVRHISRFHECGKEEPFPRDSPSILQPAAEIMNCRWQVKQMSPSMAHSMKKKGFRGWAPRLKAGGGRAEKKRGEKTHSFSLPAYAFSPGRCRAGKKKRTASGGEKFGGGGVAGVRRCRQVEHSLSLRRDTRDTHPETHGVRLCLFFHLSLAVWHAYISI